MLQALDILTTRFDPVDAELTLIGVVDEMRPGLALRGRLMGPRCAYSETVEIAYPLRPLPTEGDTVRARVVIPEASLWEPPTPFLYHGPVELWLGDRLLDQRHVTHGLRHVVLKKDVLRLNGQRLRLQGTLVDQPDDELASRLHRAGVNVLAGEVRPDSEALWDLAERLGFFLIGKLTGTEDEVLWYAAEKLARRTATLGWLFPQTLLAQPQHWHNAMSLLHAQWRPLIGIEVVEPPLPVLPGHVTFLACEPRQLPDLSEHALPKLVITRKHLAKEELPAEALGWLHKKPAVLLEERTE